MSLFSLCRHSLKFRVQIVHVWLPSQNVRLHLSNAIDNGCILGKEMTVVHDAENLRHSAIVQCIVCWELQEICARHYFHRAKYYHPCLMLF